MPENTERNPNSLANLMPPWKAGDIPNPAGRPKGAKNRSTIVRELLDLEEGGVTNEYKATKAIVDEAIKGNVNAWDKLFDAAYGKLADKSEVTGVIATGPISDLDRQMLAQYISQQSKTDK